MKLRNKKTGEIDEFIFEVITDRIDLYRCVGTSDTKNVWKYNSIAELNKDWEDYKPAEPLIKDEKNSIAKTMGETIDGYQRKIYELVKHAYPGMTGYTAYCHEYKTEDGQLDVHTVLFMHRPEEEE